MFVRTRVTCHLALLFLEESYPSFPLTFWEAFSSILIIVKILKLFKCKVILGCLKWMSLPSSPKFNQKKKNHTPPPLRGGTVVASAEGLLVTPKAPGCYPSVGKPTVFPIRNVSGGRGGGGVLLSPRGAVAGAVTREG